MMKHTPERALTVQCDSREPYPHDRSMRLADGGASDRCVVCGGRNACEPVRRPWRPDKGERAYLATERVTLREGDYSAEGLALWKPIDDDGPWRGRPLAVIEYKTLGDAISSVVGSATDALGERRESRERFEAELVRMREYAWRAIVIEASPDDVHDEAARPGRRFSAASVLGSYAVFSARFGVQVWWAGSRPNAEWYIATTLGRIWSEATGGAEARKAVSRGEAPPWLGALDGVVSE